MKGKSLDDFVRKPIARIFVWTRVMGRDHILFVEDKLHLSH